MGDALYYKGILDRIWHSAGTADSQAIQFSEDMHLIPNEIVEAFLVDKNKVLNRFLLGLVTGYEKSRDFDLARRYLEVLIRLWPESPELHGRLARSLANCGSSQEADSLLENAICKWPSEWWLRYEFAMVPFYNNEYVSANLRFHDFIKLHPERPEGHLRLAETEGELYQWRSAFERIRKLQRSFPWLNDSFSNFRNLAKAYSLLQSRPELEGPTTETKIFVLNLDANIGRMRLVEKWFSAACIKFTRIPGIKGTDIPDFIRALLPIKRHCSPGVQGCFLSHVGMWERVVVSGCQTLILEDDAFPRFEFTNSLQDLTLPADFDICFVNYRMMPANPGQWESSDLNVEPFLNFVRLQDDIRYRNPQQRGIGTDGYIITPKGAQKLLRFCKIDGIFGHLDWQLLSYCLDRADITSGGEVMTGVLFRTLEEFIQWRDPTHRLNGACIFPPFVIQRDFGTSTIENRHKALSTAGARLT